MQPEPLLDFRSCRVHLFDRNNNKMLCGKAVLGVPLKGQTVVQRDDLCYDCWHEHGYWSPSQAAALLKQHGSEYRHGGY